ncbi:hypothetical protein [Rossellomorea sp. BNER]|uniref:hypothetical protein n=1 Tax=Rossellomorea sp. BNER TaxID=2962031 RepID=UPI003AF1F75D|nr:hypothetical protein [Rossellomorea sp. BNER]
MMIGGRRNCGKTTEMIKQANRECLYIICTDRQRVKVVAEMARDMDLNIPYPIAVEELPLKGYMKEVLVDDVEDVLSRLIGIRVAGASTSMPMKIQ